MGLFDSLSGYASSAGNALSDMGNSIYDYYAMPDKKTFEADYLKEMGNMYKEFGQDLSEEDLERLKEEAAGLYKDEDKTKTMRRGVTGALLGGLYGGLSYDKNAATPSSSSSIMTSAPSGAGQLGTGYNPFAKKK